MTIQPSLHSRSLAPGQVGEDSTVWQDRKATKGTRIVAVVYALILGACMRHEAHAPVPLSFEEITKLSGKVTFTLDDGEESHRSSPLTFQIPDRSERENV